MYTLVASVVARTTNDVLLVKEGKEEVQGTWNLPGGRVEEDEDPSETAVREVKEEVGVSVDLVGVVGIYLGQDAFVDGPFLSITYLGQLSGKPRAISTDTVEAVEWVNQQRLNELELRSPYVSRAIYDANEKTFSKDIIQFIIE
ncbi:NUDIX hydrolase [Halegenticoccus tardaugens]|uniref:NUDIX hydrolase n=1 Tax=Halegenticoccus tardaugens TaxID=2071624 RepID=UPI00100B3AD8|nr:NUDIX hydrolase [Halegenticoccus tardaugens]